MSTYIIKTNKRVYSLLAALILILTSIPINSQTRIISPYSKYGIGEINNHKLSRNLGMGGIGYGYRDNRTVNYLNPASYSATDTTSFIFEAIGYSHFYQQETKTQEQISNYSSLGNIALSFPLGKRLSIGAGLKPFSLVGYKVLDQKNHGDLGTINYLYEGSGGLNEVFLGTAVELFEGFSLGVNTSFIFGKIEDRITISSDEGLPGFFRTYKTDADNINGLIFGYGLQYQRRFDENRQITFGVTYGHDTNLDISRSNLVQRELPGTINLDTLSYKSEEREGELVIPRNIGVGTWLTYNENWSGGLDVNWQNWENYQRFGSSDELQDMYNIAIGFKYSPTVETYSTVFSNADYMGGISYGQSHLNVNDYSFDEFGINFGIHMPIRRSRNGVTIGFEYAQRGTTDNNLIKEDFYRINFGINIYERWFIRRKFY